ncbi:hypothetical protein [Paenibacillus ehimensis]|uniref:Uncharacterized protein n=1 Tax=Paenibacillus ehimensis TaxID=79264 RepID=A0ABT8VMJ2_9BACL|nr:hypothetical protein [Paenibacillus ehimensis]MDO3682196.1 hypothetical protein [Paenibacillus ehimensis]MEC0210959.1 hypothetical protein [Paenibacillus ehimensis]
MGTLHSALLSYDDRGYLRQATDSVGRRLDIQTDEAGRITKVTHVYIGEQREVLGAVLLQRGG